MPSRSKAFCSMQAASFFEKGHAALVQACRIEHLSHACQRLRRIIFQCQDFFIRCERLIKPAQALVGFGNAQKRIDIVRAQRDCPAKRLESIFRNRNVLASTNDLSGHVTVLAAARQRNQLGQFLRDYGVRFLAVRIFLGLSSVPDDLQRLHGHCSVLRDKPLKPDVLRDFEMFHKSLAQSIRAHAPGRLCHKQARNGACNKKEG